MIKLPFAFPTTAGKVLSNLRQETIAGREEKVVADP
jgi:hypothetical protein